MVYYENELVDVLNEFIQVLVKPSRGFINNSIWNFYLDFTQEKFIDEIEDEQEKNPERLEATECAHYTLCFLFDLVQFIFQHFTVTREHFKASDAEAKKPMFFDHRKPLSVDDLLSLDFSFFMPKMSHILTAACEGIKAICPNFTHLLWFWHVKNAENTLEWDKMDDEKDSYDRQDNFNVIGLAAYIFLLSKTAICTLTGTSEVLAKHPFA